MEPTLELLPEIEIGKLNAERLVTYAVFATIETARVENYYRSRLLRMSESSGHNWFDCSNKGCQAFAISPQKEFKKDDLSLFQCDQFYWCPECCEGWCGRHNPGFCSRCSFCQNCCLATEDSACKGNSSSLNSQKNVKK
jgi:hypothetical protein